MKGRNSWINQDTCTQILEKLWGVTRSSIEKEGKERWTTSIPAWVLLLKGALDNI